MKTSYLMSVLTIASAFALRAADEVLPEPFAGTDGVLSKEEVIEYLLCRGNITYARLMKLGGVTPHAKEQAVAGALRDLEEHIGHSPPFTPAEVRQGQQLPEFKETNEDEPPKPLDGIFKNSRKVGDHGSIGPIRVRAAVEDWSKDLNEVTGATFTFQNNRLSSTDTWNAQGALIYPIIFKDGKVKDEDSIFRSYVAALTPAVSWNIVDVAGTDTGDAEELKFSLPFSLQGNHRGARLRSEMMLTPYYQTDLGFDAGIAGASFTYEPLFQIGDHFDVGQFHSLTGKKSGPAYLIRLLPRLDYSNVLETSRFVSRTEGDDWFRAGGKVELAFRPFGENARWELRGSYSAMWNLLDGANEFSDLIEAKALFWLSENAGLSLSYQKGQTPVADKDIDLLTLGFELKL